MSQRPTSSVLTVFVMALMVLACALCASAAEPPDDSTVLLQATSQVHRGGDPNKEDISTLKDTIKELSAGIEKLDKSVEQATGQATATQTQEEPQAADSQKLESSDKCPCLKPMFVSSIPDWNISNALPPGVRMKHAGWTSDFLNRGVGIFADRDFMPGEEIGTSLAQAVHCKSAAVHTPLGEWIIGCPTHFYSAPDCSGISQDDANNATVGLFASWMSFLNGNGVNAVEEAPSALYETQQSSATQFYQTDDGVKVEDVTDAARDDQNPQDYHVDYQTPESGIVKNPDAEDPDILIDNVAFAPNSCHQNKKDTLFHLVATKGIPKGQELLLQYNWRESSLASWGGLKSAAKAVAHVAGAAVKGAVHAVTGYGPQIGPHPHPAPMPMPMPPWDWGPGNSNYHSQGTAGALASHCGSCAGAAAGKVASGLKSLLR